MISWLKFEMVKLLIMMQKEDMMHLKIFQKLMKVLEVQGKWLLFHLIHLFSNTGILFLETLFDENAACHIALGKAYPTCVEGGSENV